MCLCVRESEWCASVCTACPSCVRACEFCVPVRELCIYMYAMRKYIAPALFVNIYTLFCRANSYVCTDVFAIWVNSVCVAYSLCAHEA